jgi:aerobic carbon-monoxide dehydrogenase small subunit
MSHIDSKPSAVTYPVTLFVNGRQVSERVEARTSLADFLREGCRLTGTHLGCEHGVCGACTVEMDGSMVRSCITLAAVCDGSEVRSIEGFDDDPVMRVLREAFREAHGLQCGFCTPGMLIAARDILKRKPDLDRRQIRVELAGNLCRCTGYAGIVRAVEIASERLRAQALSGVPADNDTEPS